MERIHSSPIALRDDEVLCLLERITSQSLKSVSGLIRRRMIHQSYFSQVERIILELQQGERKSYILKSLSDPLKHEVINHRMVSNTDLVAARALASMYDERREHYWILMEDVEFRYLHEQPSLENLKATVEKLAHFHLNFIPITSKIDKQRVLRHDHRWYLTEGERITRRIGFFSEKNIYKVDGRSMDGFNKFIQNLPIFISEVEKLPITLIHGDFDCGNVVLIKKDGGNERIGAMDWGLSHIDLPLLDLAHLLSSVSVWHSEKRIREVMRSYYNIVAPVMGLNEKFNSFCHKIHLGEALHNLYFVDWFTECILNNWGQTDLMSNAAEEKISRIAELYNLLK